MATIYGDSFGGVAAQRNYYDSLNTRIQQDASKQAQEDYQFGVQQQLAQQRQEQENQRQQSAQYYQSVQDAQRQQNQDKSAATEAYQFGAGQTERKREFDTNVDLTKKQYDDSTNQAKLNAALTSINSGEITDPADIPKLHPELTALQQEQAVAAFNAKNRQDVQAYKNVMGLTPALNSDVAAAIAKKGINLTQDEADAIQGAPKYSKTKGINLLEWDETSQRFVPNAPTPFGFQPPSPRSAPVATPAVQTPSMWDGFTRRAAQALPYVAAAANPIAAGVNYAFGAGAVQPTAPSPVSPIASSTPQIVVNRQPMGGYIVGRKYAGGLKYLGGDPSQETSWEKAGQ